MVVARPRRTGLWATLVVALLYVPSGSSSDHGDGFHDVTATDANQFLPRDITIDPGEPVRWTKGGGCHNVAQTGGPHTLDGFNSPGDCGLDAGPHTFDFTAAPAGLYEYWCTIHQPLMAGSVTVRDVAPTANAGADQSATSGTVVSLDASASSDGNGDTLTYAWSQTGGPTVSLDDSASATPSFTAPEATQATTLTFEVEVQDPGGNSATDHVQVTVSEVNNLPNAVEDTATTAEDTAVLVDVLANDSGLDDGGLTVTIAAAPGATQGTALVETDQRIQFTPAANFAGEATFSYRVADSDGDADTAQVRVSVTAVNDPPDAADGSVALDEDTYYEGTLPASDVDAGDSLSFTIQAWGAIGAATVLDPSLGTFRYAPEADANGPDSFDFEVRDAGGATDTGTITVTVRAVDDAPRAPDHILVVNQDQPAQDTLPGHDVDGDVITFHVTAAPQHGTLSDLNSATGAFTYSPPPGFTGSDSFTYQVSDQTAAALTSQTGLVSISVNPAGNAAPVLLPGHWQVAEEGQLDAALNATDDDGDTLTFEVSTDVNHGTLVLDATTGSFTYSPIDDFAGQDSFTARARDPFVPSAAVTFTIDVMATNDPPVVAAQAATTAEDTAVTINLVASDPDGDALTFAIIAPPDDGSAVVLDAGAGTLRFEPAPNFHGNTSLVFRASDPSGAHGEAGLTIQVTPVPDAPVASNATLSTLEDQALHADLPATDGDGDVLTWNVTSLPTNGTLAIESSSGRFSYHPAADFYGNDSAEATVTDGDHAPIAVRFVFTVTSVNDPPELSDQTVNLAEDDSIRGNLAVTDADGDVVTVNVTHAPSYGLLAVNGTNFSYLPDANFHGHDNASLLASDGAGSEVVAMLVFNVTAVADAPVADFIFRPSAPRVGDVVTFQDKSQDADGDNLTLTWWIDSVLHGADQVIQHTFQRPGEHLIRLEVSDGNGLRDEKHQTLVATGEDASLDEEGFIPLFPITALMSLLVASAACALRAPHAPAPQAPKSR